MKGWLRQRAGWFALFLSAAPFAQAQDDAAIVRPPACQFDVGALSFSGGVLDQARCLLRSNMAGGVLGALAPAPEELETRIGAPFMGDAERLRSLLLGRGLPAALAETVNSPVSRAYDNAPSAPPARYFVIHDTSTPFLAEAAFPKDIDHAPSINDLARYAGPDAVGHVFVARDGHVLIGHDFSVPWRATKRERADTDAIGQAGKGLFLHIELVQPRRSDPAGRPGNDRIAPTPGFSAQQYRRLAELYVLASARAGVWLIPGYHAAIDEGIANKHDDPQNFDLSIFAREVGELARAAGV